ncbi:hypothetical protein Hypma_007983 [Hypsizygus marmoreus]|uniref:F-box domain-containing protein n=1 Tax=Hypsizygus marmoreus TaxID=39966 RepID=A0A369K0B5_HYPMA|nr:hypothetical protein Hypma_007983 [Hypsizygus marmoreus]
MSLAEATVSASSTLQDALIKLPDELILCILQNLHHDDLITLAAVSRHLHYIALEVLLRRFNVDLDSPSIFLRGNDNSITALPALAIALPAIGTSPARLSCDLTTKFDSPSIMIQEARALTRYVYKMDSVEEVALQLMHPPFVHWEEVVLNLMNVILSKSCRSLSIKSLESSSWTVSSGSPTIKRPTGLSKILRSNRLFAKRKSYPFLKVCHIQTLPRFLHPFYEQTLNASAITELSFKYIFNAKEWETFSGRITIPSLSHLSISHCALLASSFQQFVTRHPSITFLDFHHNMMMPVHPPRLPAGILPQLAQLQTSSEYITHYLPPMVSLAELSSIHITVGDKFHAFSRLDTALEHIASCAVDVKLCLEFGNIAGLEAWLKSKAAQTGMQKVESTLCCVKTLELDTLLPTGFSSHALAFIPQWLRLFPVLEHVSMTGRCILDPAASIPRIVRSIETTCPNVKSFSLQSETKWFHTYSQGVSLL